MAELGCHHKLDANEITQWTTETDNELPEVFGSRNGDEARRHGGMATDRLSQQIGKLKLKQNLD